MRSWAASARDAAAICAGWYCSARLIARSSVSSSPGTIGPSAIARAAPPSAQHQTTPSIRPRAVRRTTSALTGHGLRALGLHRVHRASFDQGRADVLHDLLRPGEPRGDLDPGGLDDADG